jgi:hypothetical protein
MLQGKIITAGPRGNKCRGCKRKVKAPAVILKITGEYNRFSGHCTIDNFCPDCGIEKLEEALSILKKMLETLSCHDGSIDDTQLGRKRVRTV